MEPTVLLGWRQCARSGGHTALPRTYLRWRSCSFVVTAGGPSAEGVRSPGRSRVVLWGTHLASRAPSWVRPSLTCSVCRRY